MRFMRELLESRSRLCRHQGATELRSSCSARTDRTGPDTGAELLFEVFSQRYERGSTIVTSNLPFDEWTSVFGAERLPARSSTA